MNPSSDSAMSNLTSLMPVRPPRRAELIGSPARPLRHLRTIPGLKRGALIALAGTIAFGAAPAAHASAQPRTEVVVTLDAPSLADFVQNSRVLTVQAKTTRLDLQSASSVSYLRELDARQAAVARRIERAIPSAKIRWRYRIVLDGLAVVLPTSQLPRLSRIGGVRAV